MTGKELATWRVTHNYTQPELGEKLGVTKQTVLTWEGKGDAAVPTIVPLALKGLLFTHNESCRCCQCGGNPDRIHKDRPKVYDPYSRRIS